MPRSHVLPAISLKNNRTTYLFTCVINTQENLNSTLRHEPNKLFIDKYFVS
ncbi:hypothetical protein BN135_3306 [Cronobacter muytjensii 530]